MVLGGSGYWRVGIPATWLRDQGGHQICVVPTIAVLPTGEICPADWDNNPDLSGYDIIVLQRWMHRDGPEVIRRARAIGQVVVNDCDDYFDGLHTANAAYAHTDPRTNSESNRVHYKAIMAAGNAITVSTPFLQERLGQLSGNTVLLRNQIDLDRWDEYRTNYRKEPEEPTIGWVGSTPWRSKDCETLRGIMAPFLERTGMKFAHHGHFGEPYKSAGELMGLKPEQMLEPWGMQPVTQYPLLFSEMSLGVVPLNDIPFNHAKSAIKGYEYVAGGMPYLAQATPEYQWFDRESACRKPKHWIARLNRLADPDFRKAEWERQYALVKEQDIALHWHKWASVYEQLLKGIPASDVVVP